MDEAGGKTEKREMLPAEDHQYAFFDHSHSYVTAFYPKETQLGNCEYMMRMAIDALERARARERKTNSSVVQTLDRGSTSETSDEDYEEMKSDGESMHEDSRVDAVLKEKRVRRKLEVLAQMVGVDSEKPGVVLNEVVRVLRDLERNASQL